MLHGAPSAYFRRCHLPNCDLAGPQRGVPSSLAEDHRGMVETILKRTLVSAPTDVTAGVRTPPGRNHRSSLQSLLNKCWGSRGFRETEERTTEATVMAALELHGSDQCQVFMRPVRKGRQKTLGRWSFRSVECCLVTETTELDVFPL
ncbi:hypothetical protein H920_16585 [Fukomys damarensis]|uniref:Uncharacterized protein n=1 Tax=Fukomys damarensis TaxID=885580 RepID=A0A091CU90_FUKDA|nr:hypothetical protein H920_16585 [Fukomys damarensis]